MLKLKMETSVAVDTLERAGEVVVEISFSRGEPVSGPVLHIQRNLAKSMKFGCCCAVFSFVKNFWTRIPIPC